MNGIISIRSKTIKLLGQEMGIPIYFNGEYVPELENVIRWGSTRSLTISGKEINNAEAIRLTSNKAESRKVLFNNGIPVPKPTETEFPLVARTEKHTQGKGFVFVQDEEDLEWAKEKGCVYFSQYYPKQNEYRIHIAGGRCILMSVKEGNKNQYIWNYSLNKFKLRHLHRHIWLEDEHLRNMVRQAKKAVKVLGLDFGAVDVMADAGEGYDPFVISEVNTSPALSPLAREKYAKYFIEQLGGGSNEV